MRISVRIAAGCGSCLILGALALGTGSDAISADAAPPRNPAPVASAVDEEIDRTLEKAGVKPSPRSSDAEFLRRATIDLLGRIPTADRASAFLRDRRTDKRARLIDELLADPGYGEHFASIWYDLLIVPNDDNRRAISRNFEEWLAARFNANAPWDRIVSEILTAEGSRDDNPATVFWLAHAVTDSQEPHMKPAEALGKAAQRFLGTQIQCAECHDHPFTNFKQTEFWAMTAFFGKLDLKNGDRKAIRRQGAIPGVAEGPAGLSTIEIPERNGKLITAKFADGTPFSPESEPSRKLRTTFASWCASPRNETFARAAANRMWAHFFGRGFVNPVDDLSSANSPSHPQALRALADDFTASGFDLKHLIRSICRTQAYQRGSDAVLGNESDDALFSRMALKTMSARTLLNSLTLALGPTEDRGDRTKAARKAKKKAAKADKAGKRNEQVKFLKLFSASEEPDLPEYSYGAPQVLRLMNGADFQNAPVLQRIAQTAKTPKEMIQGLYLAVLSRPPTDDELRKALTFVDREGDRIQGGAGVLWALINSGEFILNH